MHSLRRRICAPLQWICLLSFPLVVTVSQCGAQSTLPPNPQDPVPVFDATHLHEPQPLNSAWLVYAGDNPAFARPDFDDSHWTRFDPYSSLIRIFGQQRPEVVWYRLHIKVDPAETGLALDEWNLARAFEVYGNGERLIATGQVVPYRRYTFGARILRRIPDRLLATGSLGIAVRVRLAPSDWANGQNPGYYAYNLVIGQQSTLQRDNWLSVIGENTLNWLDHLLLICLGVVALVLFAAQRRQTEYLWIAAVGFLTLAQSPLPVISALRNVPVSWELVSDLTRLFSPIAWASLYFSFVHQRIGWRWRTYLILAGVLNAFSSIQSVYFPSPSPWLDFLGNILFVILLSVIVPVVLAWHLRRGNREAGILLIPVILLSLYIYAKFALATMFQLPGSHDAAIRGINLIDNYKVGPFALSLNYISGILSTLSLALIMLLRSTRMSRRQAILEGELAAAQEVQQVLLPEQVPAVPGFTVESVYQPAQQVGGDFFQVLPAGEGGLLVVVGDVAGKGLPAAMLVSVLVGAIRGVAEYTRDPAELLANLNERLVGRAGGGFSTALVAHIAANGTVDIANAGHLSPYLDGEEVELPGALPGSRRGCGVRNDAVLPAGGEPVDVLLRWRGRSTEPTGRTLRLRAQPRALHATGPDDR